MRALSVDAHAPSQSQPHGLGAPTPGLAAATEAVLYPPLPPGREGWLAVDGGHRLRYEDSGDPRGLPVVVLHGGPGSGCTPALRRFFDPRAWRIVLLDQRGAGRSTPRGEARANTTGDLVADLERLRAALEIERWILWGGSWGATLALAYAAAHRERVRGLILRGVFLASPGEIAWYLRGVRAFLPEAWARFAAVAGARSARGILEGYRRRLVSPDAGERRAAAAAWRRYERSVTEGLPGDGATPPEDEEALADRVRLQLHYLAYGCFVQRAALLRGARRLAGVPGIIVQGRADLVCPPAAAHALHRAWRGSEMVRVEGGHTAFDPAIAAALVQAGERMRERTL
jgi:proline iminopeptidase